MENKLNKVWELKLKLNKWSVAKYLHIIYSNMNYKAIIYFLDSNKFY